MILRNMPAIVAMVCTGVLVQGCGAAPASERDDELTLSAGGDLDESVEAIRGGNEPAGGSGAVILGGARCTGVLIGTGMVLTASHCFNHMGTATSGWVQDAVSYVGNGNIYRCITNPNANTGQCSSAASMFVYRYSVSPADWPAKDIAVMYLGNTGQNFHHVVTADGADGIYQGSISVGTEYTLHGQGANTNTGQGSGVMRWMRGTVGWVGPDAFTSVMSNIAACGGDSGGPFTLRGTQWVFGLASLTAPQAPGGGECTQPGGNVAAKRINSTARNFINATRVATSHPVCTALSASSPNHWVCP